MVLRYEFLLLSEWAICDESKGQAAVSVYLNGWITTGIQVWNLPIRVTQIQMVTVCLMAGVRISSVVGADFTGGNDWSLYPFDPSDADEDADVDGLSNLCEYNWQITHDQIRLEGDPLRGESAEAAANWTAVDPNEIDSDGDSLPDGWEARYSCQWIPSNAGINPMNGSDAFNNPDGDGYDVNRDGIIGPDEALNNWMEYHIIDRIMLANEVTDGRLHPDGFETALFNPSWASGPTTSFGQQSSDDVRSYLWQMIGFPRSCSRYWQRWYADGREVWFSRWDSSVRNGH